MTNWAELDQRYMMPTYSHLKLPLAIERGEGNYLYDTEGKRYLDLFGGLAVNVLGHSHPKIVEALIEQGSRFLHISNLYLNPPAITLAKRLSELTLKGKVFFANSGAEATEAAIKWLHKYQSKVATDRQGIVVLKGGFHGRTLGALKLTRQPSVYQDFPLPAFEVIEIEPENLTELEAAMAQNPLAILLEPVLGSGGVIPLSDDYLERVGELTKKNHVLLLIDEIQTGMGRTGTLFAYQHTSLQPDLILFAKGVGGGLPLGGIIAKPEWSDLFGPGDHGTTFAPSPLSASLGNAVLDCLLEEGLLAEAEDTIDYLWKQLSVLADQSPFVKEIRGKGMMIGIVTGGEPAQVKALRQKMQEAGILIDITQRTIVRLLPPLTLKRDEIDSFVKLFSDKLNEVFS
jgi:acetylornithine/N-succinyldiaminopimelate aminotransferase